MNDYYTFRTVPASQEPVERVANNPLVNLLIIPAYEGGRAPASIAGRGQNPTLPDAALVETVTDWSPHARHGSQPEASLRPSYDETKRAFVFGSSRIDFGAMQLDYKQRVLCVAKYLNADIQGVLQQHGRDGINAPGFFNALRYGSGGSVLMAYGRNGGAPATVFAGVLDSANPVRADRLEFYNDPAAVNRRLLVNGTEHVPLANSGARDNDSNILPLQMGGSWDTATTVNFPCNMELVFLAICDGAISDLDWQLLRGLAFSL